jgi:hypothetical protein
MKRSVSVGLGLLAVSATCAAAAPSAVAQAPEFGRCQRVAGEQLGAGKRAYHGHYSNSVCTTASPEASGRYEWVPGVAKTRFTAASQPGTKAVFETASKNKVVCDGETSSGEYTSAKLEQDVVFRFTGCAFDERYGGDRRKHASYVASSAGAAEGEIVSEPTECELGVVRAGATPMQDKLGLSCGEEGEFMWLKWKAPGYYLNAEAELCAKGWWFFTLEANSMSASPTTLKSTQSEGVQKYEKFVEGPPEPLEVGLFRKSFERVGLGLVSVQTNEEAVEANSVA